MPGAPQHGQRHGGDRQHPDRRRVAPDVPAGNARDRRNARAQQVGHHAVPQIADLGPGEARPHRAHGLSRPDELERSDGSVVALPGPRRHAGGGEHGDQEQRDPAEPPRRPRLAKPERRQQGRQRREHQPPFHQPGEREQHRDRDDSRRVRPRQPQAAQRHRSEQHGVARHDVLVDDGEEHHEARGEVEQRRQQRHQPLARHRADQQVDNSQTEAAAHRVDDGDLPPRIAREHAEHVEQAAKRADERIVEVIRGIERRVRPIDDPGFQLQALEHAVAGEPALGIVEPQHDCDQERAAADHEQRQVGGIGPWLGGGTGDAGVDDQGRNCCSTMYIVASIYAHATERRPCAPLRSRLSRFHDLPDREPLARS